MDQLDGNLHMLFNFIYRVTQPFPWNVPAYNATIELFDLSLSDRAIDFRLECIWTEIFRSTYRIFHTLWGKNGCQCLYEIFYINFFESRPVFLL